jgi:hypothetical protein
MTDKIDSDHVIPKGALNVHLEAEIDRKIRVYTKVGSTAVALFVIIGTFFFAATSSPISQHLPLKLGPLSSGSWEQWSGSSTARASANE